MKKRAIPGAVALSALLGLQAGAYPLDGWKETEIHRLQAYDLAKEHLLKTGTLVPGALRTMGEVRLRLLERPDFTLPAPDPAFSAEIQELLGGEAKFYSIAALDLSDPQRPRYGEVNANQIQNPGSVGKIMVSLAFFQALADVYPDVAARERILRETIVTANGFIQRDSHIVPLWKPGDPKVAKRPIQEGDRANLWTFLDWMLSASSNAGASMMMSHLVLLKHFGKEYPVSEEEAAAFFENTPKEKLQAIFLDAIRTPLKRSGLDPERLRQGSFFTREGKRRVPGTNSLATARELVRYMTLMEQGRLVDPWSSLETKRLLYLTDGRIRYASSPALDDSAVFYKSGSLYSCKEEPGFECKKYQGNRYNFMNSVAVIETEGQGRSLHYIVAVLSNVLRKDSVEMHKALAARIHALIEDSHPVAAPALTGSGEPAEPASEARAGP